jgi:hypothetical protein
LRDDADIFKALSAPDQPIKSKLSWYQQAQPLPVVADEALVRITLKVLVDCMERNKIGVKGLRVRMLDEQEFNTQVSRTNNKASVSFTLVATHLWRLWQVAGTQPLYVAIDRQGGRTHYRQLLAQIFPEAKVAVEAEGEERSCYELVEGKKKMIVEICTKAESVHLPVALASMAAKLVRELMMARFNDWFVKIAPEVKPTAGYGSDANRWRDEISSTLTKAGIDHAQLRRIL